MSKVRNFAVEFYTELYPYPLMCPPDTPQNSYLVSVPEIVERGLCTSVYVNYTWQPLRVSNYLRRVLRQDWDPEFQWYFGDLRTRSTIFNEKLSRAYSRDNFFLVSVPEIQSTRTGYGSLILDPPFHYPDTGVRIISTSFCTEFPVGWTFVSTWKTFMAWCALRNR